jgi:hypothetical protein
MAEAHQRDKLERLCRYVSPPVIAEKRLALTTNGHVCHELKTPYRKGTTHVIFEPLDFIAKLAALVPRPQVNLTRFHGVFAPNSKHRVQVTTARRGKKSDKSEALETDWLDKSPEERHRAMTWMQRPKRVFNGAAFGSTSKFESTVVVRSKSLPASTNRQESRFAQRSD